MAYTLYTKTDAITQIATPTKLHFVNFELHSMQTKLNEVFPLQILSRR